MDILGTWAHDPLDEYVYNLAVEYYIKTETYNLSICRKCDHETGLAIIGTPGENQLCNINARKYNDRVGNHLARKGIDRKIYRTVWRDFIYGMGYEITLKAWNLILEKGWTEKLTTFAPVVKNDIDYGGHPWYYGLAHKPPRGD